MRGGAGRRVAAGGSRSRMGVMLAVAAISRAGQRSEQGQVLKAARDPRCPEVRAQTGRGFPGVAGLEIGTERQ